MSHLRMSDIAVADLELADVDSIVRYWHDSPVEYLRSLGIAPEKLPNRRMMHQMLALKTAHRSSPPTILTVKVRGESIGVHELTHVEPGISAVMHAHIWKAEHRGQGIGAVSYVRAMERFFEAHGFQRILFETPRANAGANRLKKTLGLTPCGDGTVDLPILERPMETTRYAVEQGDLPRLRARLEASWKPRAAFDERAIVAFGSTGAPALRLFCFSYAGGSSVAYKDWRDVLRGVDVCAIELPGRGRLFGQAALRNLGAVIDYAAGAIERMCDMPFALYGHSMGAVTALEVAIELARRGKRPRALIVTGSAPPHLPIRRERPLHTLARDELLDALRELETLPEPLLRKPDVLDAFLPTIRADMESRETWVSAVRDIKIPITAVGGRDDAHVTADELRAWGRYTSARFSVTQLEGGHFFIKSNQDAFLPLLQDALIEEREKR